MRKGEKFPEVESGVLPPVRMTYSAGNQLATYQGQRVRFDGDVNLVWGPVKGSMGELKFDSRNRLVEAGGVRYRYDAENQRIGVDQSRYVVSSQSALSQVLVKEEDGVKTFYVYGLGLMGEEKEGRYRSYHFDVRGSTVALTDEKGKVVDRFGYGPYGELVSGDGTETPFLFNGQFGVMSDRNGFYYMRARHYSPEIKRFVNRDVLLGSVGEGQSLNWFAFVSGRPVSFVDPFGLNGESVGFWEGIIPIWGAIRSARYHNEQGEYVLGGFYTAVAISDIFLLRAIATGLVRGACKGTLQEGSHSTGFGAVGFDNLPKGEESNILRQIYLQEANTVLFKVKLDIHNLIKHVTTLDKDKWITVDDIIEVLKTSEFKLQGSIFKSNVNLVDGHFIFGGVESSSYLARTITHHEMMHVGQFLRNPTIDTQGFWALRHELIPSFVGTPEIYFGGLVIFGGEVYLGFQIR